MKIVCVGGGPAGLYFSILMKAADPSHDIVVYERNARGDTFGWGVVFSDETLSQFADWDPPTYEAITREFAHWDAIDIHYRGQKVTTTGHGFSGVARQKLLDLLEARALELGVRVEHNVEIDDLDQFRDADLILASDGINSKIRTANEKHFGTTIEPRHCKFIWLGTKKTFDAFTFLFEENEFGVFQVHAYRFDKSTSTFIVECDEESWKKAGFDQKSVDEAIALLEKWFAPYLDGHKLLTNRSAWINFRTIKNECWHKGNIVLMGDAVHTAHFSIGSGTKLAMDDAAALARAIRETSTLNEAFVRYETQRKDEGGRLQKAAQTSLEWFETVKRRVHQEPLEFAFSLITRSKRIGYENLKLRDPAFVDRVTRRFQEKCEGLDRAKPGESPRPPMFAPLRLRDMVVPNRVVVSPMCMYSAKNGTVNDFHLVHLGSRAMGGAGLLFTEMTDVSADARISPGCAGMYTDEHVQAWKRVVDFVHTSSHAKFAMQLGHAGPKGATKVLWEGMDEPLEEGAWPIYGPSPIPYTPKCQTPIPMTRADMDRVIADFEQAAKRALAAGFDMLEVHFAHGYLLSSFLTPLSNQRTDDYGGSLENRMRFPMEVFDAVRAVWPKERPMSVRISATDWVEGGFTDDDSVVVARTLKEHGCDLVDVSSGQTSTRAAPNYGRMYQTPFADRIRAEVGIATLAVGNITTSDQVNTIVASGRADLCALARPHLRNPHFTYAAAVEQGYDGLFWPNPYEAVKPVHPVPERPLAFTMIPEASR